MTTEVRLPFGMLPDGRMVAVATVERGLACGCICSACKLPLVAAKGDVYRHHFRHHAEGTDCKGARETALHKFAKQIICERLHMTLPDQLGEMRSAEQEVWLDGIRPDVLAKYDSEDVVIEVYVAHRVPMEKIQQLAERKLTAVEIDLSYHRDLDLTEDQLTYAVLYGAPRRWLIDPLSVRQAREAHLALMREEERMAVLEHERLERQAAEAQEAWLREEAANKVERAKAEAERRAALRVAAEERRAAQALKEFMDRQLQAGREPPDLQKLERAYGGYSKITPEAWARYDADVARWQIERHFWHEK
jgi:hypothetical protein